MKSQRRHELKENVLGHELVKVGQFLKRHGNLFAWGALGIAVVVLLIVWGVRSSRLADQKVRSQYYQLLTAPQESEGGTVAGFKDLTEQKRDIRIAALAGVAVGDRLAMDALMGQLPASEREGRLREAADYYNKALNLGKDYPYIQAKAHFGLARLAETLRDFDAARQEYKQAIELSPVGEPIRTLAQSAMDSLASLAEPVRMATTAPSTVPASGPASAAAGAAASVPASGAASAPASVPAGSP